MSLLKKGASKAISETVKGVDELITSEEERNVALTKRHESDNNSDSWLAKNVRPLVFLGLFLLLSIMVIASGFGAIFSQAILTLVGTLASSAFGYYFGERNARKAMREYTSQVRRDEKDKKKNSSL